MKVLHVAAQRERLFHIAVEIDVAGEIGIRNATFIERRDGAYAILIVDRQAKGWRAFAEALQRAIGHRDVEGYGDIAILRRKTAEQAVLGNRCLGR